MTPTQIKTAFKEKGITQRAIADELGVSEMTVSKVVHRIIVSNRVMRAIAAKLGEDHRRVFPEYYLRPPKRSTSKVL
ncbi:MAG TPA: helix-turn-helix transcriptional regulator [Syntrophales bacterium]|nr:helix-turn-helix transcriptional regulator [Syntrophales bacterium]